MTKKKYWLIFILMIAMITLSACQGRTVTAEAAPAEQTSEVPPAAKSTEPPMPTETSLPTPTEAPTFDMANLVWKATHETGDISEWQQHGDFIRQGQSAYYSMVTPFAHSGKYSVCLTIDTDGYSDSGSHAAYLFYWDQLPEDAYYYSAWYYIPAGTQPQYWWNVWQWKSTYNGNSDYSVPMFILDILEQDNGQLALHLVYRPDIDAKVDFRQNTKTVPTDQWFHIEAYYEEAYDQTGQVIVWQDGEEILNVSNVQTVEQDKTVFWSVNHYSDEILPAPSSIYIDDAAITTERLGPNVALP